MNLRPYQLSAVESLLNAGKGNWLVQSATGTGKTLMGAEAVSRLGLRTLWVAHRRELLTQAANYCGADFETVQTLSRRPVEHYPVLVIDEAHHATAATYLSLIEKVKPDYLWGLTATPNRGDGVGLDKVFTRLVFEYPLTQAIQDGWLVNVRVRQQRSKVSLDGIRSIAGDYATAELERLVNIDSRNNLIADLCYESQRPMIVFAVDVAHAEKLREVIAARGLRCECITGKTREDERARILNNTNWDCLVNVQVVTEGIDIPDVRTVVLARPTRSSLLYTQMAGRGLRLAPNKVTANLIDITDNSSRLSPCSAPTLLGLDAPHPKLGTKYSIDGDLLNIPAVIRQLEGTPEAVIYQDVILTDWAKANNINLCDIRWVKLATGELRLDIPDYKVTIPPCRLCGEEKFQQAIFKTYQDLLVFPLVLWKKSASKGWGSEPASDKQLNLIRRFDRRYLAQQLTRGQASQIITYLKGKKRG